MGGRQALAAKKVWTEKTVMMKAHVETEIFAHVGHAVAPLMCCEELESSVF